MSMGGSTDVVCSGLDGLGLAGRDRADRAVGVAVLSGPRLSAGETSDVRDLIDELVSNGWRHGEYMGLLSAVRELKTEAVEQQESGMKFIPGSRPPWRGEAHAFLLVVGHDVRMLHTRACVAVFGAPKPRVIKQSVSYEARTEAFLYHLADMYPRMDEPLQEELSAFLKQIRRRALVMLAEERPHAHIRELHCPYCQDAGEAHKMMMCEWNGGHREYPDVYCSHCRTRWSFETSGLLGRYQEAMNERIADTG